MINGTQDRKELGVRPLKLALGYVNEGTRARFERLFQLGTPASQQIHQDLGHGLRPTVPQPGSTARASRRADLKVFYTTDTHASNEQKTADAHTQWPQNAFPSSNLGFVPGSLENQGIPIATTASLRAQHSEIDHDNLKPENYLASKWEKALMEKFGISLEKAEEMIEAWKKKKLFLSGGHHFFDEAGDPPDELMLYARHATHSSKPHKAESTRTTVAHASPSRTPKHLSPTV